MLNIQDLGPKKYNKYILPQANIPPIVELQNNNKNELPLERQLKESLQEPNTDNQAQTEHLNCTLKATISMQNDFEELAKTDSGFSGEATDFTFKGLQYKVANKETGYFKMEDNTISDRTQNKSANKITVGLPGRGSQSKIMPKIKTSPKVYPQKKNKNELTRQTSSSQSKLNKNSFYGDIVLSVIKEDEEENMSHIEEDDDMLDEDDDDEEVPELDPESFLQSSRMTPTGANGLRVQEPQRSNNIANSSNL